MQKLVEPGKAMLLDDELELVQDAIVIVGVGQGNLALPERIENIGVG